MRKPDVTNYISSAGRSRRRRRAFYAAIIFICIAYLVFLAFCFLLFRTKVFRASKIEISGNLNVTEDAVYSALQAQILGGSYLKNLLGFNDLFIWPEKVGEPSRFLPQVKEINISKDYWDREIDVRVVERTPYGIWCVGGSAGECFWFDETGFIFKKGFASEGNLIKTVNDHSGRTLGLGGSVLDPGAFANLETAFSVLEESGVGARSIELADINKQEVTVKTDAGPDIYMSLRFPSTGDADILKALVSGGSFSKLRYVDLRVQGRAYYK